MASSVTPISKPTQIYPLPSQHFYSIEYPGYVPLGSISDAVHTIGGQRCINNAFKRTKRNGGRDNVVDLNFRPNNPFAHPVSGDVITTNNLLLKIVKRRRKRPSGNEQLGEYTTEVVGLIPQTLRFRSMVDFQYEPSDLDAIANLRFSMDNLDAHAMSTFKFEQDKEEYITLPNSNTSRKETDHNEYMPCGSEGRSNLSLIPPPLFSRQGIPLMYNFKQNPMSIIETSVNQRTGQEKRRYINRFRWKGWSVTPLSMSEKEVPTQPTKQVEEMRCTANPQLYAALKKRFEERPIWTKQALLNQFSPVDAREISNTKYLIPLFCYVFIDGPWRDTLVRFGYDPRNNITSRLFQRIYFRNVNNPTVRPSVTMRVESKAAENTLPRDDVADSDRRSHIFDGKTQSSETASFQLCDIYDPLLENMIHDESELRDICHERDGWFTTIHLDRIKVVLRHKFFSLLEGGIATDVECQKLLEGLSESKAILHAPTYSRKARRHNKAKGALPPEEEAAARLRKALAKEKEMDR